MGMCGQETGNYELTQSLTVQLESLEFKGFHVFKLGLHYLVSYDLPEVSAKE